jgi:parallel beta-helix repeat protein
MLVCVAALALAPAAQAVVTCSGRTPAAITLGAADSQSCQDTIAKAGRKFLKTKLKVLGKCKLGGSADCPTADDQAKINGAITKAVEKIAAACADDAAQAGLSSSYADETDDAVITSCMLSQHNVVADLVSAITHGATTEAWIDTGKERAACVKEISKSATKFVSKALGTAAKCLKSQAKLGTAGDLAPVCLGSFTDPSSALVPPSDAKTATKQADLQQKIEAKIADTCAPAETLGQIATIFACPGATSVADLQACVVCAGWNGVFDAVEQQFAERGEFVAHAPGALQLAVGTGTVSAAANAGKKFLIESGTYQEEVNIFEGGNDMQLVGCGGASDDRPRIIPPMPETSGRGIRAANVDGLLFQSLDFFDQLNDHIFVAQAQGVTFRDITGDGNRNTAYAVFPVRSNDVLVELLRVRAQDDAPIYVGQSSTIVVRYNDVREGVAGIEIENCGNAQVYGNYGTGNTAGLMVFKDNDLPIQLSECHDVHHNLFEANNEPNFGTGTVAGVPKGTGILVISNDSTPFSYNIMRDNETTGITFTTQDIAGFTPPSEQTVEDNYFFNNWLSGNGLSPDPDNWPLPAGYDVTFITSSSSGNCESDNVFDTEFGFAGFASPPNIGTCPLPPPAVFPGCPAPPIP